MRIAALALGALLLAGCATSYQPDGFTGGFHESPMAADVYRITFRGNAATSPARANDFALLRAAELTLRQGYTHFFVVDARAQNEHATIYTPTYSDTTGQARVVGNQVRYSGTTTTHGGQPLNMTKPGASYVVRFVRGTEAEGALDAQAIAQDLRRKYGIKAAG